MKRSGGSGAPPRPGAEEGSSRPSKRSRGGAKPSSAPPQDLGAEEHDFLDSNLLERMVDYIDARGGSCDFGHFAAEFAGVKKRQLEPHFDFVPVDGPNSGRWEIGLSEAVGGGDGAAPTSAPAGGRREDRSLGRVEGRIRFFDRSKGYGFMNCEEQPGDVFFPRSSLPRELQEAQPERMRGLEVSFELRMKDGKPRADQVSVLGGIPEDLLDGAPPSRPTRAPRGEGGGPEISVGTIVRYDEAKGYGFIAPDDRSEDIFFLRAEMPPEMASFHRKEDILEARVEFEVEARADGKFRAKRMVLLDGIGRDGGGGHREREREQDGGPRGRRVEGRIVRFDRAKGYGFIHCPDEPEDIFFLPSVLPRDLQEAYRAGDSIIDVDIEVEIGANEEGKPRAVRILPAAGPSGRDGGHHDRSLQVGIIISFDAAKGFGFIKPEGLGEDVFYLRSELPPELVAAQSREQVVDQRVEFEVRTMPDGKLRAQRLTLVSSRHRRDGHGGGGGHHRDGPPRPIVGRVRKFDRAKGYGFIETPGESDVFFLPSALPKDLAESREPLDGMEVTLEYFINDDGKPRANRVQPLDPRMGYGPMPPFMPPPMGPHMGPPMGPPPMGPPMGPPPMGMPMGPHMGPPMGGPMGPPPMGPMMGMGRDGHPLEEGRVHAGSVVTFDALKGFGFIAADGIGEDVFFPRPELPSELREAQSKDEVVGQRVEFELRSMPDGKLRAKRILLLRRHRSRGRHDERDGREGHGRRQTLGRILRYDRSKGYGFIGCEQADNVFFLRSLLPRDMQEMGIEELKDTEVAFELVEHEEGKPRANHLEILSRSRGGSAAEPRRPPSEPRPQTGDIHTGFIVRFDPAKGYGFVKADQLDEDIFFLRSEMPSELAGSQHREDVEHQRVEFEVRSMPDGKLRAQRMELARDRSPGRGREERETEALPALDPVLLTDMEDFLARSGGRCDYGKFSSHFPKVKKRQLEQHFEFHTGERGIQRIELPEGHPGRDAAPPEPAPEGAEGADDVPPDEPAIPLGKGCLPHGVIKNYDAVKGFGFVTCEGFDEDIFFPRTALPEPFHCRRDSDMPELAGVEVSLELNPSSDRGPRAERMSPLLRWHAADRCWLLKRR